MATQLSLFDIDVSSLGEGALDVIQPTRIGKAAVRTEAKDRHSIGDFGRKIGGARKDLWSGRGLMVEDLAYMNADELAAYVKKNAVWPPVKWREAVDSGCPLALAWLQKRVRDSIPATPVPAPNEDAQDAQRRYVRFVTCLRDAAGRADAIGQASALPSLLLDEGYVRQAWRGRCEQTSKGYGLVSDRLMRALKDAKWPDELAREARRHGFTLTKDEKEAARWHACRVESIEDDVTKGRVVVKVGFGMFFMSRERCEARGIREDTWLLWANGSAPVGGFASKEDAMAHVADVLVPKAALTTRERKKAYKPHFLEHIEREGPPNRGGPASGEDYLKTFGFYGGEFGNWLNDKDRQANLDLGYDAFRDLALALGIQDADVSLGGRLSIAFGARGNGSAVAHYEPARRVINLTKLKGAGSLGHEWVHALDHYIGAALGAQRFASESPTSMAARLPQFGRLMEAMRQRTLTPQETRERLEAEAERSRAALADAVVLSAAKYAPEPDRRETLRALSDALADELRTSASADLSESEAFSALTAELAAAASEAGYRPSPARWAALVNKHAAALVYAGVCAAMPDDRLPMRKVETDYLRDARRMDRAHTSRGHTGYWTSEAELLARAGAAWIKDRLEAQGIRDDYLCAHADGVSFDSDGVIYISPQGAERSAINKAFDDLVDELKLRGLLDQRTQPVAVLDDNGVLCLTEGPWPIDAGAHVVFTDEEDWVHEGQAYPLPEPGQEPGWLEHAESISWVQVPRGMGVRDMRGWFEGCANLLRADLSGILEGCDLSHAFRGCRSLRSVGLPRGADIRQYGHEGAFEGCMALIEADKGQGRIPEKATLAYDRSGAQGRRAI